MSKKSRNENKTMRRIKANGDAVPSSLHLCAPVGDIFAAKDIDAKQGDSGPKRFEMTAYTGGAMRLAGWQHPVVVDLAGMQVSAKSRPILKDHNPSLIVGHTESVRIEGSQLKVSGVISGAGRVANEIVKSSLSGFPWQASIGAAVEMKEMVPKGKTVQANGRAFDGPVEIVRRSRLGEISFVALGADDDTEARVAAKQSEDSKEINMDFNAWLNDNGFEDVEALSDAQLVSLRAMYDAERGRANAIVAATADDDDVADDEAPVIAGRIDASGAVADLRAELAAETRRANEIRRLCAGGHPEIEIRAISEGWDVSRTELEILRADRPQISAIRGGGNSGATNAKAIEAALCMSAGLSEEVVGKHYDERTMNSALSKDLAGAGIHTLLHEVIRASGGYARPGRVDNDTIRMALNADRRLIEASGGAGFSTISLTGIISNVANKTMLTAYEAVPSVAPLIASETDVNDFKEVTRYRLTGVGVFEKVGPDGELKSAELSEEGFTSKVETYGRMITLTRQMIINDDLGAFLQIPRIIGRMSALKREEALFELILSNPGSFFSAGNRNFLSGANTALSIDSLTEAEQLFLDQTDSNGKPIMLSPSVLLTPTSLKVRAQQLMTETRVNETTATNKPSPANNPHAGKFTPVATPYLNSQGIAGGSAFAWYLFANPADVAAVNISYLRGRRVPTIESGDADFNTLGVRWRGFFDFGVSMQDHRAAVKVKGEA